MSHLGCFASRLRSGSSLNGYLAKAPHSESSGDSDEALQSYVDLLDDNEEDPDEDPAVDKWDGPASISDPGETHPIESSFSASSFAIFASTSCSKIAQAALAPPTKSDMTQCGGGGPRIDSARLGSAG
ncbi:hypothetical protein B0H19DRAFT_1276434 [Mycena capillaripes]|nr:hypothetical protein B0H19DRAFT_1276434 [Mycena capillaripes]